MEAESKREADSDRQAPEKPKETKALIKDEYLHLQKVVEDFDARTITIKSWSVSFSLAAFAAAFASSAPGVLLVSSGSALLFWLTEAYWKEFQAAYKRRIGEIEDFFADPKKDIVPMQITRSWHDAWKEHRRPRWLAGIFWRRSFFPTVLPHGIVLLAGLLLFGLDQWVWTSLIPEMTT